MIVVFRHDDNAVDVSVIPSGWVEELNIASGGARLCVYTAPVPSASAVPDTITWTLDGSGFEGSECYGFLSHWRGVDLEQILELVKWTTVSGSAHDSVDVSPHILDGVLALGYIAQGESSYTPPGGMNEEFDDSANVGTGSGLTATLATLQLTVEGQVGQKRATYGTTGNGFCAVLVVRPESPIDPPGRWLGVERTDMAAAGQTLTITKPAEARQGRMLYAVIATDAENEILTAPTGWELIDLGTTTFGGDTYRLYVYMKICTEVEPSTYSWTTSASVASSGIIGVIDGVESVNVSDNDDTAGSQETSHPTPDITPTLANTFAVLSWFTEDSKDGGPHTFPDDVEVRSTGAGTDMYLSVATVPIDTTGAIGTFTVTISLSEIGISHAAALAPNLQPITAHRVPG
jgi:hypothetical protein